MRSAVSSAEDELSPDAQAAADLLEHLAYTLGQYDESEVLSLTQISENHAAGRGGRLRLALRDIFDASELMEIGDEDKLPLAEAMMHNAIWHVGRLLHKADPDGGMLEDVRTGLRAYAESRGQSYLDFLKDRDLISENESAEFANGIADQWVEAFSTDRPLVMGEGKIRQPWNALVIMFRAQRAKEIAAAHAHDDGIIGESARRAIALTDKSLKLGRRFIDDPDGKKKTYDFISAEGPAAVTRAEAITDSISNPAAAAMNKALNDNGPIQRYTELVEGITGKTAGESVIAASDRVWLDQVSDYQAKIFAPSEGGIIAIHDPDMGIVLSPEIGANSVRLHAAGQFDEVLAHEKMHTSQPKKRSGRLILDEPRPEACSLRNRHAIFEEVLLEGATQQLTNELHSDDADDWNGISELYNSYSVMVDEVAKIVTPDDKREFMRGLSDLPHNKRTAYLTAALTGNTDEESQRNVFEPLLTAILDQNDGTHVTGVTASAVSAYRSNLKTLLSRFN